MDSPKRTCSVEGCESAYVARGWCRTHYGQWYAQNVVQKQACAIDGCERPLLARGWCRMHYQRWQKNGGPLAFKPQPSPQERFWSNVDKRGSNDCWEWASGRNAKGYGSCWDGARVVLAHRFAYALLVGSIPEGLFVCHHCDNPPCVNPAHLFVGTNSDNMADMDAKGRRSRATGSSGVEHYAAKLTRADVDAIRACRPERGVGVALAAQYGVSTSTISRVVLGKGYRPISDEGGI